MVLGATVFREHVAQAAQAILPVVVTNTAANPVPVTSAPPPLWQGTPYTDTRVIFGSDCVTFEAIPEGKVLYVQRGTASFNVAPGRGATAAISLAPLGASLNANLYIPTYPSGPVNQVFGVYDGYQGTVDIELPTAVTPQGCLFALTEDDVRGRLIITGYLVDAP
jgi:hypothetical protein